MASSLFLSSPMATLPDDLLYYLLRCIRLSTSLTDFVEIMLVCKRFYSIGLPIALEFLRITNSTFDNWFQSTKYIGYRYFNVRHLTITLNFEYIGVCEWGCTYEIRASNGGIREPFECSTNCVKIHAEHPVKENRKISSQLLQLALVLRVYMQHLATLALSIDIEPARGPWCMCYQPPSQKQCINEILDSLPSSLQNLRLDTGGCDSKGYSRSASGSLPWECHFCKAVRTQMQRLKHLWLRTAHLCEWFFLPEHHTRSEMTLKNPIEYWLADDDKYPDYPYEDIYMRGDQDHAFVWTVWNAAPITVREYHMEQAIRVQCVAEEKPRCLEFSNLESLAISFIKFPREVFSVSITQSVEIARQLAIATHKWEIFPKLRGCNIIDQHLEVVSPQEHESMRRHSKTALDPSFGAFSDVFIFDIINDATTILPFRWLLLECQFPATRHREQPWYGFRDQTTDNLYFGSFANFDTMIDHDMPFGWVASIVDSHVIPRSVASSTWGFDIEDPRVNTMTYNEMEAAILEKGKPLLWFNKANASIKRSLGGIVDMFEARDPLTGDLGTQGPYILE